LFFLISSLCKRAIQSGQPSGCHTYRVGQNHIYTVYIWYFWQGFYQIYGHIRCIYTVLANPAHVPMAACCLPTMLLNASEQVSRCFLRSQGHLVFQSRKSGHTARQSQSERWRS
jgi:hypothetical protein